MLILNYHGFKCSEGAEINIDLMLKSKCKAVTGGIIELSGKLNQDVIMTGGILKSKELHTSNDNKRFCRRKC
jgi:hypothetical protein